MDSFLKIFRIQLIFKVLYMGILLCTSLNLVFVIYIQYVLHNSYTLSYTNFIYILSNCYPVRSFDRRWNYNLIMVLYEKNICFYTWKLNFGLVLSHFLENISTAIDKVVSMLFSQCQSNAEWTYVDSNFIFN